MSEPPDPNRTVDEPSVPADSLDAGLAAGFAVPRSSLDAAQRPVLLQEAEGESAHVVKPNSDAMPEKGEAGDRYQLFGEIARGGMGAVLRGRDVDLGRDLAIKVLLEKHAHRPEVARRFLEEAQIGGQLQHPGVVPVYDIGRFGERPFFTMKLVKGQTLAALLAERTDPSADRPRLLAIALQVAQALAYAHAKGVIHRDLKPANIMVGAFGEVQVMDWGLAKVLAEGGIADEEKASRGHQPEGESLIRTARSGSGVGTDTEAGSLLGTPAYMPPEQANGDVALLDRRCDVFGLGAILCEILTGKPPYVGRSSEEVRRKAANGDLADALCRLNGSGADGDLIVLTKACLSPEAMDRPRDAQAVADRLMAYLDGVQERLRQAELAEAEARARAREEGRRRRLTLALAATVLLALTLGGGGWLYVMGEREARQAQVAREVNEAMNRATALREQARSAQVGRAALFAQAREQVQRALALVETGPADPALVAQVRHVQDELDEEEKDRKLLAALEAARLVQAETVAGENRYAQERAIPLFREALRAYGLTVGEGEPAAVAAWIRARPPVVCETILAVLNEWTSLVMHPLLQITERHQAWLLAVADTAEADDDWARAFRAARGENDIAKKRAALRRLAEAPDVVKRSARTLTQLAHQLDVVQARTSAVRLLRRAQERYPADFWVNQNLGMALGQMKPPQHAEMVRFLTTAVALRPHSPGVHLNLGISLASAGRYDDALDCFRRVLELQPNSPVAFVNSGMVLEDKGQLDQAIAYHRRAIEANPKFAIAHFKLGAVLLKQGRLDEAVACFRTARTVASTDATSLGILGEALREKGQIDEAILCYRQAVEIRPGWAASHNNLGALLCDLKHDYDGAIACFRKAIELDPNNAGHHTNLGHSLKGKALYDQAIASYRKALTIDPHGADIHNSLGAVLCDLKHDYDGAIACFRKAIELDPKNAVAHANLGNALHSKGQVDDAITWYQKAIELNPQYADGHNNLGNALFGKGVLDEAITCFLKAIELNPQWALAHNNLGKSLKATGRIDEAIASFRKAIAMDPTLADAHNQLGGILCVYQREYDQAIACFRKAIELNPHFVFAHANLGKALEQQGRLDDAIACFRKAIALDPKYAPAHNNLGITLARKGQFDAAIASHRKAVELDPTNALRHRILGEVLGHVGKQDEAIVCFRKAIELAPRDVDAYLGLGLAQTGKNQVDEAIASYRKAIQLDPTSATAHTRLGSLLGDFKRDHDGAIASFRKAIALDPKFAFAHNNLGIALANLNRHDAAIASYRKAIELAPKFAEAHYNLGHTLAQKGQQDEAIACFRRAIELTPRFALAYANLGNALRDRGRQDEALACFRKACEYEPKNFAYHGLLGQCLLAEGRFREAAPVFAQALALVTDQHPARAPLVEQADMASRMDKLEQRLPDILRGVDKPGSPQETMEMASMCHLKRMHVLAVRFAREALAADARLGDNLKGGHRYDAACFAVMAASGKGKDAGKLDPREWLALRRQALTWLRADLALRHKQLETGQAASRVEVQQALSIWQQDADLAGIRDKSALGKLSPEERDACERLWRDVAALRKKAEDKAK